MMKIKYEGKLYDILQESVSGMNIDIHIKDPETKIELIVNPDINDIEFVKE